MAISILDLKSSLIYQQMKTRNLSLSGKLQRYFSLSFHQARAANSQLYNLNVSTKKVHTRFSASCAGQPACVQLSFTSSEASVYSQVLCNRSCSIRNGTQGKGKRSSAQCTCQHHDHECLCVERVCGRERVFHKAEDENTNKEFMV